MCQFCEYRGLLEKAVHNVFGQSYDPDTWVGESDEDEVWQQWKRLFRRRDMQISDWDENFTREVKLFAGPHGKALWKAIVAREKDEGEGQMMRFVRFWKWWG